MPAAGKPSVGQRIREERAKRGISVRGLARDVGVSASLISQIETGKSQPSVSTLYAITSALGISIQDVFDASPELAVAAAAPVAATPVAVTPVAVSRTPLAVEAVAATFREAPGSSVDGRLGPVVRPDERQVLLLDSGVTWERLGQIPSHSVDFLLVTYAPGGTSSSSGRLMRHSGVEYGFLLRGELVLTLGFEERRLGAGDAISFDSATPHRYHNDGTEEAVGVWFVMESPT